MGGWEQVVVGGWASARVCACSANLEKEKREKETVGEEKVNMYSGANVEITAEATRGRRLCTMSCV